MIDEPATSQLDASSDPGVVSDGRPAAASEVPAAVAGTPASEAPLDLDTATQQALLALRGRSPDPRVCPFLRVDGDLPPEAAATGHRCVAGTQTVALTERQGQLVCRVATHPTCPRYTRGEAAVRASLAPGLGRRSRAGPAAIGTAAVLLVIAAAVAVTSGVAAPGGEVAGGGSGGVAGATATPGSAAPTDQASAAPSAGEPGASGLPAATLAPLATVRPTLVATRDLPAVWRGLEACPAPDACYLYVVKRGDTISGIAARFKTTVKKLRKLNPALDDPNALRVRQQLRVPPPSD